MRVFYFDASVLAKAYVREKGSPIVETILERTRSEQWLALMMGLLEVASILVRKKNGGVITLGIFQTSLQTLTHDFIEDDAVLKIEATNEICAEALQFTIKHEYLPHQHRSGNSR